MVLESGSITKKLSMGTTTFFPEDFAGFSPAALGSLSAIELDGYLTAIVIGPELIMPSEWLTQIWEIWDPSAFNREEAQALLNTVMLHYNSILHQLEEPETYLPYGFTDDLTDPDTVLWASVWAQGFDRAFKLHPEAWLSIMRDEKNRGLIAPIMLFVERDGKPALSVTAEEHAIIKPQAARLIPRVIPAIRNYWRKMGGDRIPRRSHRIGRNEPCPCDSGKKYKRCCGSN